MSLQSPEALKTRLRERLALSQPGMFNRLCVGGLSAEDSQAFLSLMPTGRTPAAVLVPVIDRPEGLTVLLTERAADLRHHAGQIAFPGGRIEPTDTDAIAAALRETREEIGLGADRIEILGFLDDQLVISGYRVTPVVGLVQPGFELIIDQSEVATHFEVPLTDVLDPARHQPRKVELAGVELWFKDVVLEPYTIWGMTGSVLLSLARLLTPPGVE